MAGEEALRSEGSMLDADDAGSLPLVEKVPEIPIRKSLYGPMVAGRLRRFYALQFAVALLAMLPVILSASPSWQAFGLGIVWPGAGFLYAGGFLGVVFALLSFAVFLVSVFYWWARGVILLPPAVLVITAALSGTWVAPESVWNWVGWAAPCLLAGFHALLYRRRHQQFAEGIKHAEAFNASVADVEPLLRDAPVTARPEMTESQIAEFRRMLDLALQPIDQWEGFTEHDKWQQDSLRYQVCTPTWNLAMIQYSQLPAFHGYLSQAQENLIRKHIERKTWDYWRYESLWGNFSYEKDPVAIDNIMLSGFLGVSVGMFEAASNTSVFKEPGALTFKWDDNTAFKYNHSSLCEVLVKNFKRYDLGWFPCEPRWIYSMCNLVGLNALLFHDNRHGTDYAAQVSERFFETMDDEMLLSDGRLRVCTSVPFGFTVPTLSGLFGEAWGIRFLTTFAPDKAERLWEVLKRQFISIGDDGDIEYKLMEFGWDTRQPSDFKRWADLNPLVLTLWAATEMGDEEVVQRVSAKIDEKYGSGMAEAMTYGKANTVRDMVTQGLPEAWRTGPILQQASYPDVIVTRAVSDGAALNLVLVPGDGPVETSLQFARLTPGARYQVQQSGEEVVASAEGSATLTISLKDRVVLDLVPVG